MMAFRGRVAMADMDDVEVQVNRMHAQYGLKDQKLCPGAEACFEVSWLRHAAVCLGCRRISTRGLKTFEKAIFEYASKEVSNTLFTPLSSSRLVGATQVDMPPGSEHSPTTCSRSTP
jgi:hypothetical protein